MGIHDLLPLLRRSAPAAFQAVDAWQAAHGGSADSLLPVAVDVPIFMHKFAYSVGAGAPLCRRMLRFADDLRAKGLLPTFVFDGGALPAKDGERTRRKDGLAAAAARRSEQIGKVTDVCLRVGTGADDLLEMELECSPAAAVTRPTPDDYAAVRAHLSAAGLPMVSAKFEAEAKCVAMVLDGTAAAVLTEDSDALAYACPSVLLHWGGAQAEVVSAPTAASALGLSAAQFQDMCVLLGNDFNARPRGFGPVRALRALREHGSLDGVLEWAASTREPAFEQLGEAGRAHMRAAQGIFRSLCFERALEEST